MPEEKLFSFHKHSDLESEKITAPRYSYWQSVFRVFFRKKTNIVILALFAFMIAFAYIYPALTEYDKYGALLSSTAKHLSPKAAIEQYGFSIKNILGTGAAGQSTFDAIWNGSRISISLAFMCGAINMTIGVIGQYPLCAADLRAADAVYPQFLDHGVCPDRHRLAVYRLSDPYPGGYYP